MKQERGNPRVPLYGAASTQLWIRRQIWLVLTEGSPTKVI